MASASVDGVPLIGAIELSQEGDLASPVDIETALNLLDARVTNPRLRPLWASRTMQTISLQLSAMMVPLTVR